MELLFFFFFFFFFVFKSKPYSQNNTLFMKVNLERHFTHTSYSWEINLPESDMYQQYLNLGLAVIVMVVLICLLFIDICYNCFWSRSINFPDHQQNQDSHVTTPRQANHRELEATSVFTYGSMSFASSSRSSETETCAICLDEYVLEDTVTVLPRCKHMYHKSCLDLWLQMRSFKCPICRDSMIKQSADVAGTYCRPGSAIGNSTFPFRITVTYNAGSSNL